MEGGDSDALSLIEKARKTGEFSDWENALKKTNFEELKAAGAYEEFLKNFPFCFGYWSKFAEATEKDSGQGRKVYEEGVAAVAYSADMWLKYVKFLIKRDREETKRVMKRAVETVGNLPDAEKLWKFIFEFLLEDREANAIDLAENFSIALQAPLSKHNIIWDLFLKYTDATQRIEDLLTVTERNEGLSALGETEQEQRQTLMARRRAVYDRTTTTVETQEEFERPIQDRLFYHNLPLKQVQLDGWRRYIRFRPSKLLFERCLIACGSYVEFWIKYADWLESNNGDKVGSESVLRRGCSTFLKRYPSLHFELARNLEYQGKLGEARGVFEILLKEIAPGLIEAIVEFFHFERRQNNLERAERLLIDNLDIDPYIAMQLAKFYEVHTCDLEKGVEVLRNAVTLQPENIAVYVMFSQLILKKQNKEGREAQEEGKRNRIEEEPDPIREGIYLGLRAESVSDSDKLRLLEYAHDLSVEISNHIDHVRHWSKLARVFREGGMPLLSEALDSHEVCLEGQPSKRQRLE